MLLILQTILTIVKLQKPSQESKLPLACLEIFKFLSQVSDSNLIVFLHLALNSKHATIHSSGDSEKLCAPMNARTTIHMAHIFRKLACSPNCRDQSSNS